MPRSAIRVGDRPDGTTQVVPARGAPQLDGNEWYLYVSADVGVPLTRCVTTTTFATN